MKILVTGGAGFVGSNLVRLLLKRGHQLTVLDNFSNGSRDYLDGLDLSIIEGDIRDTSFLKQIFSDTHCVVHLAAMGNVVESVDDPVANFDMNTVGTFSVLNAAVAASVKKLVFSSTGGALMGNTSPPVNEKSLPKPISPYGASKLCCEAYCNAYSAAYGLKTVVLRFANVYGPYCGHKKGVINQFYKRLSNREPITIYGDGSSTRDYIHASDLCRGIMLAVENTTISNDTFHIASGQETSLSELADICRIIFDSPQHEIIFKDSRPGEVEKNFASFDYAKKVLGFTPKYKLEQGLSETFDWLAANDD